ncbi:MAG: amidohydrolase family protein [Rhodospirillaceae bacterium]
MASLFDTHFHILDHRFPLTENQGYAPPVFTVDDYRSRTRDLDVRGGVVVAASFQGYDTRFMYDALGKLGPTFVGVINVPADVPDDEVLKLDAAGVRAVRFNLVRGGSAGLADLDRLARRVHEIAGWHAELYVDLATLGEEWKAIANLPKASIDHLGMTPGGLKTLVRLAERGVRVKATGFGRITVDSLIAMSAVVAANPQCLMFGSDLPSQRARRPFAASDIDAIREAVGERFAPQVLFDNAVTFYRPRVTPARNDVGGKNESP